MTLKNLLMTQRMKGSYVLLTGGPFPSFVVEKGNRGLLLKFVSDLHQRGLFLVLLPCYSAFLFRAIPFSVLLSAAFHHRYLQPSDKCFNSGRTLGKLSILPQLLRQKRLHLQYHQQLVGRLIFLEQMSILIFF